jgi:hypothetical protein
MQQEQVIGRLKNIKNQEQKGRIKINAMIIYQFVYSPNIYESGPITIGLYKTYERAEKAMNAHRDKVKERYENEHTKEHYQAKPYDLDKYWGIEETEVKD